MLIGFYWAYIPAATMSTKKSQDNITTKESTPVYNDYNLLLSNNKTLKGHKDSNPAY